MSIRAEVTPSNDSLEFNVKVTGEDEVKLRRAFDLIRDDGDFDIAMRTMLDIAASSIMTLDRMGVQLP